MENVVSHHLQSVQFGQVQRHRGIAILPLMGPDGLFQYRTLGEAIGTSDVTITEVSDHGSVPELRVVNRGASPVLLIDGEELAGAKQNRVLNTSILIRERSDTRIPVSCTERGRWSYATPEFSDSGNVLAQKARARKMSSVSDSLERCDSFHSNQGEVWSGIAELQEKASHTSPTSAMYDVFQSRADALRECLECFTCVPGQVGLLAFIDGRPAGFDLVSLGRAYSQVHSKLVRSYALEGLLTPPGSSRPDLKELDHVPMAIAFMGRVALAIEKPFPSVGCGQDLRFRGEALAGTALVHADEVIHSAFFQLDSVRPVDTGDLASLGNRRRWHRE